MKMSKMAAKMATAYLFCICGHNSLVFVSLLLLESHKCITSSNLLPKYEHGFCTLYTSDLARYALVDRLEEFFGKADYFA